MDAVCHQSKDRCNPNTTSSRSNGLRFIILLWIQDSPATSNSLSSFNQFAVGSRHADSHLQSHASPGFEVEDLNSGWSRGFA
ncbi:hypothetical protein VN97_g2869 [Penicillium thymicola]|uniref:Uncharacterized protein n=1 Tax=Penicillium thymicola TaxID=293382 RepID=A0AAI9XAX5_PENTH|nr:hypothetical protein VN97_g2869 [Penicillium thymicola]